MRQRRLYHVSQPLGLNFILLCSRLVKHSYTQKQRKIRTNYLNHSIYKDIYRLTKRRQVYTIQILYTFQNYLNLLVNFTYQKAL